MSNELIDHSVRRHVSSLGSCCETLSAAGQYSNSVSVSFVLTFGQSDVATPTTTPAVLRSDADKAELFCSVRKGEEHPVLFRAAREEDSLERGLWLKWDGVWLII